MEEPLQNTGNGADVFIDTLNELGIDRIFLNPGIDLVPIMAAVAKCRESNRKAPRIILCADESVAVSAAHGYAMVSGKPQVVAVFEDIGTLQGGGAIVNLQYGRVPVIICSGRNQSLDRLNWLKEPFDQRKIVRDYMKWDHDVSSDDDIAHVFHQAYGIASTEPCGPVYLTLARENLMGKNGESKFEPTVTTHKVPSPEIDVDALEVAADLLFNSTHPLIMTAYLGRNTQSVSSLVVLAEALSARVITTDLRMNFPSSHSLCPGIDCIKGDSYDHYIEEADVILLIDYNFPGPLAKQSEPKGNAKIIHFDNELLKNGKYLWGREPDISLEGNSSHILHVLNEIVRNRIKDHRLNQLRTRYDQITKENERLREHFRTIAIEDAEKRPINPDWLCYCLNEVLDDEAIIVHQIPSNADAMERHIRRTKPGTLFTWGDNAGSMGWALPAALGAKIAAPDKLVVSIIGDGGFIYGCPVATLWGASAHHAPFLTIIFNNQSYAIFKEAMEMLYGDRMKSAVSGNSGFEIGIDLKNSPDFATIANGCNAFGQTVDDPSDIMPALKHAIDQVQKGQSAVIDVKIG